jgi:hypothetical protein
MQVEQWLATSGVYDPPHHFFYKDLWDGHTSSWRFDKFRTLATYMRINESIMASKRTAPTNKAQAGGYLETQWISLDLRNKVAKAKAGAWMIVPENILNALLCLGEEGGTLSTMPDKDGGYKTMIFVPLKGGKKQLGLRANARNAVDCTACCLYKYAVMLDEVEFEADEEDDEFGFG